MKIAMVCTEKLPVPPIRGGAVQIYIEGVVRHLSSHADLTIFGIEDPALPAREVRGGVEYVRLPGSNQTVYLDAVSRELAGASYDLIHVFNRPKWVLTLHPQAPKIAWVLSIHNEMFDHEKISRRDAEQCIDLVSGIATVSQFIRDSISSQYPEAGRKCRVIYSGVDTEAIQPAWSCPVAARNREEVRQRHGLGESKVILFVGRLTEKKGAHIVLHAMPEVLKHHPDAVLIVVGSKWYGENQSDRYTRYLADRAAPLGGKVIFTGFLPPAEAWKYYAAADLFVCASQWEEPLSRTLYEAMAAGLPIVTTSRGGNAEVVRGTGAGLIVDDYDNPLEFASYINFLLSHPARAREMGETARDLAERMYDWKRVASDLKEFYLWALQNATGDGGVDLTWTSP